MKKRLDIALVEQGLVPSRERAKSIIMAGQVYVNGQNPTKPEPMFRRRTPLKSAGKPSNTLAGAV